MRSQQRVLGKRGWIKLVTGVMTILMGSGGLRAGEYRITASGSGPIYGYGAGGTIAPGTAYKTYTITRALWSGSSGLIENPSVMNFTKSPSPLGRS